MKTAYINGIILDGTAEMKPIRGKTILVEDGVITGIISNKKLEIENLRQEYEIVNLHGRYIMPGLINLHVHIAQSGKPPKPDAKPVDYKKLFDKLSKHPLILRGFQEMCAGLAKTHLMSGSTTIRTVGGIMQFDSAIRDRIRDGKMDGPRILCANMAVSVPGGHFAGSLGTEAHSPEEAVLHVQQIASMHPDLIKLMITGGVMDCEVVGEPGLLKMPPEMVRAACDEAHRLGYKVAAHVESPEGVKVALANGVDTIEHSAKPDDEMMKLFHESGAAMICTISPALPYAVFDRSVSHCTEEAQINGKVVMDGGIECTKRCLAEEIPVGLGNDASCPFITPYDFWRELVYFCKYCGVSNAFALHTATLRNARIAGIDGLTGSIENGKAADFIVTDRNPLEDLTALRQLYMVVAGGKIYRQPKVKRMKAVDAALDPYL